jgi:hypothetical protein
VDRVEECEPHYRNRVDASVSGGERETPAADERRARTPASGGALAFASKQTRAETQQDLRGLSSPWAP